MTVPAYRITVEVLDPTTGEGGLESLSFFASTSHDIFAAAGALRDRFDCSACRATRLAVGLSLLNQAPTLQRILAPPLTLIKA
jgi:hypothetical protein